MRLTSLTPWLLSLLGLYAVYIAVLYLAQSSMIYPGAGPRVRPPLAPDRADREVIWLQTSFGRVEAWLLPARPTSAAAMPAIVLGHGNAELIDTMPEGFLRFRDLGYAVLQVEYPGYGDSDGEPSMESVTEAFVAAYDALAARPEIDAGHILGMGRSLGGGAICALAAQRPLQGLILVATFTDLRSLAASYLAPGWFVRDPYDNLSVVRAFDGPVLVAHGNRDRLIPRRHGERLAAAASRGRLLRYDSGHGECPPDFDLFWRDEHAFLDEHDLPLP